MVQLTGVSGLESLVLLLMRALEALVRGLESLEALVLMRAREALVLLLLVAGLRCGCLSYS